MSLRLLTFSTLYPNAAQPQHGVFVEHRLRHLLDYCDVEARVVAPVPWFPFTSPAFGRYATFAAVPASEHRHAIDIIHPRYPVVPKFGMAIAPRLLATWARPVLAKIIRDGWDFDVIDAHFFYPDGVAAAIIGRVLGKPVVITGRGTDIHTYTRMSLPRRAILWAAEEAAKVITVSEALKAVLVGLGVDEKKVVTLRNGVDLALFSPGDREAAREKLDFRRRTLVSVGNLRRLKGHDLAIHALSRLPDTDLVIIGDGEEERTLKGLTSALQLDERVRFVPSVPQSLLSEYYSGADALLLASEKEGWPNVLLEAMACGTPVVAADVWGIPEIVSSPAAGVLMTERSPSGLVEAINRLFTNPPERARTRAFAQQFDWSQTSKGQLQLFTAVLAACADGSPKSMTI